MAVYEKKKQKEKKQKGKKEKKKRKKEIEGEQEKKKKRREERKKKKQDGECVEVCAGRTSIIYSDGQRRKSIPRLMKGIIISAEA